MPEKNWSPLRVAIAVVGTILIVGTATLLIMPSHDHGPIPRNESFAIGTLRSIVTAEMQYQQDFGNGLYFGTLASLSAAGNPPLLDAVRGSGTKAGYTFVLRLAPAGGSFTVRAGPRKPGETGERYFFTDPTAVVRHARDARVDASSPLID